MHVIIRVSFTCDIFVQFTYLTLGKCLLVSAHFSCHVHYITCLETSHSLGPSSYLHYFLPAFFFFPPYSAAVKEETSEAEEFIIPEGLSIITYYLFLLTWRDSF